MSRPAVISTHCGQTWQGVAVGPVAQLSALARMRALVVFPTPRTPVNRKAWATRFWAIALPIVVETCSCPIRS